MMQPAKIPALAAALASPRWTPAATPGDRPRVEWHPTDTLIVDSRFQRDLANSSRLLIRRIVENFQWRLFGIVICTDNGDGSFTVIDGQHRAIAAAIHPACHMVPVFLTDAETLQEQAAAFLEINRNRVAMNALQMHKARRLAGDDAAAAIARACDATGIIVPGNVVSFANLKPRQILCITSLYRVRAIYGDETLRQTLATCTTAWPDSAGDIMAVVVKAVAMLIGRDAIPTVALVAILRTRTGDEWQEAARAQARNVGCDQASALVQIITDHHARQPKGTSQ